MVVTFCAIFVCSIFLNYNLDLVSIEEQITSEQGKIFYDAVVAMGKVVVIASGGCLTITTAIMLIFYIKNYIDCHEKELGILKALGYSNRSIAKHFWVFGLSVFVGCVLGHMAAWIYMPQFYEIQNKEQLFPAITPQFHGMLTLGLIGIPSIFFMGLAIEYATLKMKTPVLALLKEMRNRKVKISKKDRADESFLQTLKKNTLKSKKILVFFIGFSAFCFSAMIQMSFSMNDLASGDFAWLILSIGLVLAFMTLFMSLTSVVKANTKTIAMMKVFGYSQKECEKSILGSYRPISYLGFLIGTVYQFVLLKLVVTLFFASYDNMPEYHFNWKICLATLAVFLVVYEIFLKNYAKKMSKISLQEIMLE